MRVVVTGAAGFIGRALVARLLEDGVDVVAVDRRPMDAPCPQVLVDVREAGSLAPLLDAQTTVIHLAALTSVPGSVCEPQQDFSVNVDGFFAVLEAARARRARLVFASSASVFDPTSPLPHSERAPKWPNSPYAAAKLAAEGYCAAYHKCYGLDVRIARLFNVYGPGMTRFAVYDFYGKIRNADNAFEILGDGSQVRDYLFVSDAVEGLLTIAERGTPGDDYNLATGIPTTSLELARTMMAVMGRPGLQLCTSGRSFPGDVPAWYADIGKIRCLGFAPATTLADGLCQTVQWFEQYDRNRSPA